MFAAGELWRRAIEAEAGAMIRAVQAEVDGTLSPTWRGYALRFGEDAVLEWRGSLRGYQTRLVRGGEKVVAAGLLELGEMGARE